MGRGIRLLVALVLCLPLISQADIGFLLHESIGNPWYPQKKLDTGFLTQGGHGAILVSDLCAETPTQIRKCKEGEAPGIVISRYDGLSKEDYDWLAVPVSWYFDGVPTPAERPLFGSKKVYEAVQERFYNEFLSKSIARVEAGKLPPGRWQDTVAASFRRDIYNLSIKYDGDTQAKIVDPLMNTSNKSSFDFFLRNCSDFAGDFFKDRFDKFTRTNLGDVGFTSPKGVAWSVNKLGKSLAPGEYSVYRYTQSPGDVERSRDNLYAIENTTKHPKWAALMLYFGPQQNMVQGGLLLWSLLFRFNAEGEFHEHFSQHSSIMNFALDKQYDLYDQYQMELNSAQGRGDTRTVLEKWAEQNKISESTSLLKAELKKSGDEFFGTDSEWNDLKQKVVDFKKQYAVPSKLFDKLDKNGLFAWEDTELTVTYEKKKLIIAGPNVGSGDTELARWVRVSRLEQMVNSDKKNRPEIAVAKEELKLISEL